MPTELAISASQFPDLPISTYSTGDGFGNPGPGGSIIHINSERLILNLDDIFWITDEYRHCIYSQVVLFLCQKSVADHGLLKFDASGIMITAIRPSEALIPTRNRTNSFLEDSPPY